MGEVNPHRHGDNNDDSGPPPADPDEPPSLHPRQVTSPHTDDRYHDPAGLSIADEKDSNVARRGVDDEAGGGMKAAPLTAPRALSVAPATAAAAALNITNPPHAIPAAEVARNLRSHLQHGLTAAEAALRLERDGPNKVETSGGTSALQILARQVSNSLTAVLVAVMVLSFIIQDYIEASVVAAVIVFNIVVGYVMSQARNSCVTLSPYLP